MGGSEQNYLSQKPLLNNKADGEPVSLEGYMKGGGLAGLRRARQCTPLQVITQLRDSGLRGRGSDARPVYRKWWEFLQDSGPGLLLVDGREADPDSLAGAFLLENNPFGLIEGLCIAARVSGVREVRLRLDPGLEVLLPQVLGALEDIREQGAPEAEQLNIMAFDPVRDAPPNKRGRRLEHVLETWFQIALVLSLGASDYRALGREGQAGTRLLTVGDLAARPVLVETPMGSPLGEALAQAGRKASLDPAAKALSLDQGVSGFLPLDRGDLPLAPEELMDAGLNPGLGAVWVVDRNYCLVDLTRRALYRIINQGLEASEEARQLTLHAIRLVTEIALRRAQPQHLEHLEDLAAQLRLRGAAAARPLQTSLRYFRDEWDIHLKGLSCPAFDCQLPLIAPCQSGCPAGIDIPSFMALVGQGRYRDAVEVIRRDNPFPYICGLVCPAPCESICLRSALDEPVSIRAMKAVAARHALEQGGYPRPETAPASGRRAAVIGSGPAGLSAAYFLALAGHQVTVYEALEEPGGTPFTGIPAYRLPREVIRAEVDAICDLGVELVTGRSLGRDFTLEDLCEQGFEAVFLGIGSHQGYRLGVPGEDEYPQVHDGIGFLKRVALGDHEPPASEVVVVGGGNAAMDAARTLRRLGCERVTVAYRRTRDEMPAHSDEIDDAQAEGIEFQFLTAPIRVTGEDGRVTGLECIRTELGPPDDSGRRRPQPVEGSEFIIPAGAVIAAIGQRLDSACLGPLAEDQNLCGRGVLAQALTGQTCLPWLFAGGDAVTGPATVVEAVAAGKKAAQAMDSYLRGAAPELGVQPPQARARVEPLASQAAERAGLRRPAMPMRSPEERAGDFKQVELGLDDQMARNEAVRCLRCDICIGCGLCQTACAETGARAIRLEPAGEERFVFADFLLPAERCTGCGACVSACPNQALVMDDQGDRRRLVFTGSVLKEHELVACSICHAPYASQAYLDKVTGALDDQSRTHERLDRHICPTCARQIQARERWAKRFAEGDGAPQTPPPGRDMRRNFLTLKP